MTKHGIWTVIFDDRKILKKTEEFTSSAPGDYVIEDDAFWSDSKWSNIHAIQFTDDNTDNDQVEHKDANEKELMVNEINSGIYIFETKTLMEKINLVKNSNNQNEFYLTDIFNFINSNKISIYNTKKINEIHGINTLEQLEQLSKELN